MLLVAGALAAWAGGAAAETTLQIGLAEDPDALDPTLAQTYVGRIVFAGLCDKLFDITPDLKIVPQLATAYEWSDDGKALTITLRQGVTFQDGEKLDAEAAKFSIERHLTMPGSKRRSEISTVQSIDVVDDHTLTLHLSTPFSPLVAQLTDRSGMMVSPKAAKELGDKFSTHPVCAGPYKFVERIAQDHILLEKWPGYWDKDNVKIDKIIYQPIPDSTVRLANLRSGQLDFVERVAATDVAGIKDEKKLQLASIVGLGYQGITINVANGDMAKNPLGQDARVRKAFELVDRPRRPQPGRLQRRVPARQSVGVAAEPLLRQDRADAPARRRKGEGAAEGSGPAQPVLHPDGRHRPRERALRPGHPVDGARGRLRREAPGHRVRARARPLGERPDAGLLSSAWSGRTDPDGNIYSFLSCKGALNDGHYCNETTDKELGAARTASDPAERIKHYAAAAEQIAKDDPIIYLFHQKWIYAFSPKLKGFTPVPDGLVRVKGLTLQ